MLPKLSTNHKFLNHVQILSFIQRCSTSCEMIQLTTFVKDVSISFASVLLFIPTYIFLILIWLLITVIIKPYRSLATFVANVMDPEIGEPLSGMQAAQSRDFRTIHKRPETVQVACLRFKGPLKFEEIMDAFHRRVVIRLDKDNPNPTLEYPELQKYLVNIMGYLFLKKDKRFNVANHFTLYNPNSKKGVTKNEVIRVWESLLLKPFPKKRSPWECLLIDNYIPDNDELEEWSRLEIGSNTGNFRSKDNHYWIALIRMHHSLADGFAIMKILSHMSETEFIPHFPIKLTPFQKFLWNTRAVLLGPYDALGRLFRYKETWHALHQSYEEHARECHIVESAIIKTTHITRLKLAYKVPYTAILLAAISGGLRRYYIKYNHAIPSSMSTALPVAVSDHSGKLRNEYSLAVIPYATHLEDPKERVQFILGQLKSLATSSWLKMFDVFVNAHATLPNSWFQFLTEKSLMYSSTYSTMPGPKECIKAFESTLLEATYAYGTSPDSPGFGISSLTYNGYFRFVLFIDKNLVKSFEVAEDIINFIHDELTVLERCIGCTSNDTKIIGGRRRPYGQSLKCD